MISRDNRSDSASRQRSMVKVPKNMSTVHTVSVLCSIYSVASANFASSADLN